MSSIEELGGAQHSASAARERAWTVEEATSRLVSAIDAAALHTQPFAHIYMESAWPPSLHARMLDNLPGREWFQALRHADALRPDGSSTRLRMYLYPEIVARLPASQRAFWLPVAHALRAQATQDAIKARFRDALERRFARNIRRMRFFPVPILLRDLPGYRIGIHADAPSKAITMQFYLPRDAAQRHLGTVLHEGRDGEAARRCTRLAFLPGAGYAFPVMPDGSWHSVPATTTADGERVSMMVTWYVQDGAKRWLTRRYDRLRCFLGIGPRG